MLALESSEMKHKVFTIILLLLHLSCISPGVQHPYIEDDLEDGDGPLLQPLNLRLPRLLTSPASLLGPPEVNITAWLHSTAVLPCRVSNLGSGSVTWLRWPQLTVLSAGRTVFTSSRRIGLEVSGGSRWSPDYNLVISPVRAGDAGEYRCQVNTGLHQVSRVSLQVVTPEDDEGTVSALVLPDTGTITPSVSILGPSVLRARLGAQVILECVVRHRHAAAPAFFTWYVLGRPLDLATHPGGLLLSQERRDVASVSRLVLGAARLGDGGLYTCSPAGPGLGNASVTLSLITESGTIRATASILSTLLTLWMFLMSL